MSLLSRLLDRLLPPATDPKPDDLVVVAYPEGEAVGELWAGMLKDGRIRALLRDVSPLNRGYLNWAPVFELLVRCRDLARAREILGVGDNGVLEPRSKAGPPPG
ncbi:MAG: hypothetical protein ACYDEB_12020 [Dehalococcoidia bacterium]